MPGVAESSWTLNERELLVRVNPTLWARPCRLVAMTRVRNESLILRDTLDHVGAFADAIVAYDDASEDDTLAILQAHSKVAVIIRNTRWEPDVDARLRAETRHRGLLLSQIRAHFTTDWCFCFDADERYVGDIRGFVAGPAARDTEGVRLQLFDAYLTPDDGAPYTGDRPLLDFRRWFGPERRDILMMWRNRPEVHFAGLDSREPKGVEHTLTAFYCQHYGKSLSVEHWEATCDYYANHFPEGSYGRKWRERKGRAIHQRSDFDERLYHWGPELFAHAIRLG